MRVCVPPPLTLSQTHRTRDFERESDRSAASLGQLSSRRGAPVAPAGPGPIVSAASPLRRRASPAAPAPPSQSCRTSPRALCCPGSTCGQSAFAGHASPLFPRLKTSSVIFDQIQTLLLCFQPPGRPLPPLGADLP